MTDSSLHSGEVAAYERDLAEYLDVDHVVALSSGTAALQTALYAAGVRAGDKVLVPALAVIMSVAPVVHLGAQPVFVDCDETGTDFDYDDLATKAAGAVAVLPVYLWGRAADPARLHRFATARGLPVVADACQAIGTTVGEVQIGTDSTAGCFSTHEFKLLSTGEGGFLTTDDDQLADRARAYRTHWQTPPPGSTPLSEIGHNFRLAAPLAALGRTNLTHLEDHIVRRIEQTTLLRELLAGVEQLAPMTSSGDQRWNHYSPLFRLHLDRPRAFAERLARAGVPNSTGTFRLIPLDQRPMFHGDDTTVRCTRTVAVLDGILAVALTRHDDAGRIDEYAEIIAREVSRWGND